jgi:hypothetical protein
VILQEQVYGNFPGPELPKLGSEQEMQAPVTESVIKPIIHLQEAVDPSNALLASH